MAHAIDPRLVVVDRWFASYDDRDVDAMVEISHPRIEVVPERPLLTKLPGATFHGHRGLRTLIEWSFEAYPGIRVESVLARKIPGWILSSAEYMVDNRQRPAVRSHTETLFDIADGRVRRVHVFRSGSPELAAALTQPVLTPREREVFSLLACGLTAPQIAERLVLSPTTVRTHVQNAVMRLGAETRLHALSIAMKRGEILL
jgi:DNA-binding CsgD family transcriptional regulator